jgi:pilus assembly protein CpaF
MPPAPIPSAAAPRVMPRNTAPRAAVPPVGSTTATPRQSVLGPPATPSSPVAAPSRPRLVGAGASTGAPPPAPAPAAPAAPAAGTRSRPVAMAPARRAAIQPLEAKAIKQLELQAQILERLVPRLSLDTVPLERLGDEELWQKAESAIVDLVETMDASGDLPKTVDQDQLIKDTLNEALGLGPLEDLLADDKSDEIVVDRRDRILVGKAGQLSGTGAGFSSDASFRRVVERLVAPTGHKIDDAHPLIDVRLRDGSRLTAAVPPVSVRGACLTLRKPRSAGMALSDLVGQGALSPEMADFLTTCVGARKNLLVCGAPGAGKSAVLAALAGAAPDGERIVSVEEVAELAIGRDEWIALEARPSDGNGLAGVDLVTLLRGALRLRPDRLVVGDVRGGEALELIQAMGAAADGTLVAIAGDGARAALGRFTSMAQLAAPGSSTPALRELVAGAVDVVVHVARYADGEHRVASIEEVLGGGDGGFQVQELFGFRGAGAGGGFAAAGVVPRFYAELEARGLAADASIFRP